MRRKLFVPGIVLIALIAVVVLVGCGGSDSSDGVADLGGTGTAASGDTETSTTGDQDPQEIILEYTDCLRDEGFDVPDPDFSGGQPGRGGGDNALEDAGIDPDDPDFQAAQEKCSPILEGIQQQFADNGNQEAFQEAALEYAQCMRKEGIDVPDPDFSQGPGQGGLLGDDVDRDDPDFKAADEKCQSAFDGLRAPGGGDGQ